MEIYLDKRAVRQIRLSAADAIEEGDLEALKEDIHDSFPEDRVEAVEQMTGGSDFMELLGEILEEWSGDDIDELFELLETQLGDQGIDLKVYSADKDDDDDDEDDDFDGDFDEAADGDDDDDEDSDLDGDGVDDALLNDDDL